MHYYLRHSLVQPSGLVFLSNGHRLLLFKLNTRVGSVYVLLGSPAPTNPNLIIQVWITLTRDRLTKIKSSMLYDKPKVWLFRARDNDYTLKLECDCAVLFISQLVVEGVKKRLERSKLAKTLTTKTWYLGRVYRRRHKIDNRWIENCSGRSLGENRRTTCDKK
jgi:hypothetical protein